ncbi:NAD-dependent succinate-semialdehyde dehydrogenase [Amorphus sp. 3PC139-8]|uniref:NAD-dependent succinate-semialdehyde dehydrogenase n=1 Tax=Amorphus sp. 3PC139-8 TaxID=2735676 RepID=UPI00345DD063
MSQQYGSVNLFIDGAWRETVRTDAVVNPATGAEIGRVAHAEAADLEQALDSSRRGFEIWRDTGVDKRTAILLEAARLIRERAGMIGDLMSQEQGKPVAEARGEVMRAAALIGWDIEQGRRIYGRTIPGAQGFSNMALKLPIGPVAGFTPWNFPASIPARKLSALAAGCSLILKAAEETPATAAALVQCYADAGLPAGVLNLLFGDPAEISEALISSPVTRMVTLTGSLRVGKLLAGLAASHMKPVVMELGGHAPVIVCEDADAAAAARMAVAAKYRNCGQICTCPTRFIVHEAVYDTFVSTFVEATKSVKIGGPYDEGVQMGAVQNQNRIAALEALVADARAKGANVLLGGNRMGREGFFFEPTILADVPTDAEVLQEEPFGPVAVIQRFGDLDQAIEMANATPYGLASYAFTNALDTAARLSERVEAGHMSINHLGASQPEGPFGGVKGSGYGREGGIEGVEEYTFTKYISAKVG